MQPSFFVRFAPLAVLIGTAALALPAGATAQAAQQPPCASAEHRQFDFWAGDWEVRNPAGQLVGTNRIRKLFGGCVLQEHWEGTSGSVGESYNIYDASTGAWHQTWVDNSGLLLLLEGGLEGESMVLRGETAGRDGSVTHQRITWTPSEDGTVRQHWESSTDGESWTTAFDGTYAPAGSD